MSPRLYGPAATNPLPLLREQGTLDDYTNRSGPSSTTANPSYSSRMPSFGSGSATQQSLSASTYGGMPSLVGSSVSSAPTDSSVDRRYWEYWDYSNSSASMPASRSCIMGCGVQVTEETVYDHTERHFPDSYQRPLRVTCRACGIVCDWEGYTSHIFEHSSTPQTPLELLSFLRR